jgi:integrase
MCASDAYLMLIKQNRHYIMAKVYIGKRVVDAATPSATAFTIWDAEITGFGLKVTPAGGKVYIYRYRAARPGAASATAPITFTIGKHGNLTPDQARKRARELAVMVATGADPRQLAHDAIAAKDAAIQALRDKERLDDELSFDRVSARWLSHYENEKIRRPRTVEQAKHVVRVHLLPALTGIPVPNVTRTDLQAIIDAIPVHHRSTRLAVYAYASVLFRYALERGEISDNPIRLMAKPAAPAPRLRVLTDSELAQVWLSADTLRAPYGSFYKLLLLTGQRREEVAGMNWSELDRTLAAWTIPASRAKNNKTHIVPLSAAVIAELDSIADVSLGQQILWPAFGPVLTSGGRVSIKSYSKGKVALDKAVALLRGQSAPIDHWRVHDLRRTLATGLQKLGVRFEVTEAVLNHTSGSKGGVAGVYQRHDWADEKRAALEAWAAYVGRLVTGTETSNVIALGARA